MRTYDLWQTLAVLNALVAILGTTKPSLWPCFEKTGAYVAMENTATPLTIGCSGVTATPVAEFHGRMALPFVCGKALSSTEVVDVYDLGRLLMGL